MFIACVELCS